MRIKSSILFSSLRCLAASGALAIIAAGSSMADPITFAQFIETDGAQDWSISEIASAGTTTTTVQASGTAYFSFQGAAGEPFGGLPQLANFTLTASSSSLGNCATTCVPGDGFTEAGYSGSFSFTDATPGALFGSDFLSGIFSVTGTPATSGAQFTSNLGSGNASFTASATAGNLNQLVFASAYLNFPNTTIQEVASFSLSSLIPNFGITTPTGNQAYPSGTFTGAGTGTFSSNPAPETNPVPEPATLALIGAGLLGIGTVNRKKLVRL